MQDFTITFLCKKTGDLGFRILVALQKNTAERAEETEASSSFTKSSQMGASPVTVPFLLVPSEIPSPHGSVLTTRLCENTLDMAVL